MKFFALSLSNFNQTDISSAIDELCHTKRATGETAFPDLPTIEEYIFEHRDNRLKAERLERERVQNEAERQHREKHPEEYVTLAEIFEAVKAKRAAKLGGEAA